MDLIGQLASTLGVDNGKAEGAAGAILGVIKQNAPAGALDGLVQSAPQASGWIEKAGPLLASVGGGGGGGAGGLLGALGGGGAGALGALGGALGGSVGGAMQGAAALGAITSVIEKLGIPPEIAAKAIPLVISFVQKQLGDGGFASLAEKVPMLKDLAGGGGGDTGGGLAGALGGLGGLLK
jgi:Protein of unknown function VcgC/VcgE (DUF2780)